MPALILMKKQIDWTIRASPHYYNTREEIDRLKASLQVLLEKQKSNEKKFNIFCLFKSFVLSCEQINKTIRL